MAFSPKTTVLIFITLFVGQSDSSPCPNFDVGQLKNAINKDPKIDKPPFSFNIEEISNDQPGFYQLDKNYIIRLTSNDKVKLKSFLIQPRFVAEKDDSASVVDQKVGQFVEDESWALQGIQTLSCQPLINDSLARLKILDPVDNAVFKWHSPSKSVGPIQFVITILSEANNVYEFWLPLQGLLIPASADSQKVIILNSSIIIESSTIKTEMVEKTTKSITIKAQDPCLDNPCRHGGTCSQNGTSVVCKCPEHFMGQFCQWECPAYLCQNGGKCTIDSKLNYLCICTDGFIGNHCEEKVSGKLVTPQSNNDLLPLFGGTDTSSTPSIVSITVSTHVDVTERTVSSPKPVFIAPQALLTHSDLSISQAATAHVNGFSTPPPFVDDRFKVMAVDEAKPEVHQIAETFVQKHSSTNRDGLTDFKPPDSCSSNDCRNGATCIPSSSAKVYTCKCANEFSGELCQWGCPSYLCQNGGTCFIDERRNYKCHCLTGFGGLKCDQKNNTEEVVISLPPPGEPINGTELWLTIKGLFAPSRSVQTLIDQNFKNTDEKFDPNVLQRIEDAPIDNRRRVKFLEAAEVKKGPKELLRILLDPDFCETNFCYNNGTCNSNQQTKKPECACTDGWTGARCSVKNFCFKHECRNDAECISGFDGYKCKCRQDFSGKFCNTPCPSSSCQNGGKCRFEESSSSFGCDCQPGFSGDKCETQTDDCKFQPCHNGAKCIDKINGFDCQCTKGFMGSRCHLPCKDSYKNCQRWKEEGKCNSAGTTNFYQSSCPASCGFCSANNQGGAQFLSPTSLEPLHFLLGRWVLNSSDVRQYPYDLDNAKNGYYQELEISHTEVVIGGRPALNYTTIMINNDDPKDKIIRVGFITMSGNATSTNGSIYTTGSDGITIVEEGELTYLRLDLTPTFIDAPKDKENKVTTKVVRTLSLFGIYLKEAVDRNLNGIASYFTKFYYKAS